MKTYIVQIEAVASKMYTVRAQDEEEATDKAWERAERSQFGWSITLPGDDLDHIRYVYEKGKGGGGHDDHGH